MKKLSELAALALGVALAFGFASCETEVEKIVEVEKPAQTDTSQTDGTSEKQDDTTADETPPANVTDLAATAKDSRVLLTWTDAADEDIYGYEVSYSGTAAINRSVTALDKNAMVVPQGAGGTYISGLANGTEYTFTVKSVDTSGNKSEGVTAKATPAAIDAGETLKLALSATVPHENKNGVTYTGNKSNTSVTVKAHITTASAVKRVVYKKNGSLIAKTLLADEDAVAASVTDDNTKWTFTITATDESENGSTYTVAAIDEAGREEAEQITIDHFDFTPPAKVKATGVYSSELATIILNWTEPADEDYDHVEITYTANDGTGNSAASEAVSVAKGTANKTFTGIDGTKAYYAYTFVTYDALGNAGDAYTYRVSVNKSVSNVPEGFVEVTGATVSGAVGTGDNASQVFITDRIVTIGDLYVSDHEVTQAEYETYCKYGNEKPTEDFGAGDDFPAYFVSWYDAIVYCNLRSMDEELEPVYQLNGETDPAKWTDIVSETTDGVTKYCGPSSSNSTWDSITMVGSRDDTVTTADGYRLPTEAEWEYIARGANESTTAYSGSDTVDDVAWYMENSNSKTNAVKTKDANGLDIYDMSGNVWEWCWDWFDFSEISASTAATGSASGKYRVLRGGSWYNGAGFCAVSCRYGGGPNNRSYYYGFRVVRSSSK